MMKGPKLSNKKYMPFPILSSIIHKQPFFKKHQSWSLNCRYFISVTIMGINVYSVKVANRVGIIFTFTKVVSLGIIIIAGIVFVIEGRHFIFLSL